MGPMMHSFQQLVDPMFVAMGILCMQVPMIVAFRVSMAQR